VIIVALFFARISAGSVPPGFAGGENGHLGPLSGMSRRVYWLYESLGWTMESLAQELLLTKRGAEVTTMIASPLTAADRCDRCGAQAFIRATLASGSDLLFCAHHAREYESGLKAIEADIYNESDRLAAVPSTAPTEER
jgi:hypothetical protein